MKMILKIARMELQKMFYSPIAWLILIIFAAISGFNFMSMMKMIVTQSESGNRMSNTTFLFFVNMGYFIRLSSKIYLLLPLLTMDLLSKEFGSGSIKLLYSSPISNRQIVFGKFLSMMVVGFVMILILLTECLYGFSAFKAYDFSLVATGLLGFYLLICTYAAIGLFMSSLTSYQIVAAVGTFATFFFLQKVGEMWQGVEFIRDITYWLSIGGRAKTFFDGLICSEDLLYFILVPALFISFTIFRLKGIREKTPKSISFIRYTGAFLIVALIGYVSTIPSLMKYHDSTRTNLNTLTEKSQEVISKLKGKVSITTYVNIFGNNAGEGMPRSVKYDMDQYKEYRRFKPDIKMEYKYYYALPLQEEFLKLYKEAYEGMTIKQALKKACRTYRVKEKRFKPGKEYLNEIDLESELNRFVRKIETEDGKVSYLRTYGESFIPMYPEEPQNTAAFKKLVMDLPLVGYVEGHEERDVNDFGSQGYFRLNKQKTNSLALINNGFDFTACELSKPVDKNIDILVLAEAKTMFSAEEMKNLNDYIDRGGNLIIACDRKRQEIMNPLVERFGVKFLPGQLVEHNKGYTMDMITSVYTEKGKNINYYFERAVKQNRRITMPGTVAISYEDKDEFQYMPVLVSDTVKNIAELDSIGSWNELQTTDFIDDVAKYDPKQGETLGAHITALGLIRKVGEKDQKIMILGDADCLSNDEIGRKRKGFLSGNSSFFVGIHFWMSDNEFPIDIRRPRPPDDKIYTKISALPFLNTLYKIIIPALLTLAFLLIWLRRKGR